MGEKWDERLRGLPLARLAGDWSMLKLVRDDINFNFHLTFIL